MEQKDFSTLFSEEASNWKKRISELAIRMRNIREVAEVQVDLFSDRQKVLEYCHTLGQILSKLNAEHRKKKRELLVHYTEGRSELNVKYGANEKTTIIEGDLSELKYRIELVDGHISGMNEVSKTIDHMLYGIKTRIQLEDYLRNGSVKS